VANPDIEVSCRERVKIPLLPSLPSKKLIINHPALSNVMTDDNEDIIIIIIIIIIMN